MLTAAPVANVHDDQRSSERVFFANRENLSKETFAGKHVIAPQFPATYFDKGVPVSTVKIARPSAVETEIDTDPSGNRKKNARNHGTHCRKWATTDDLSDDWAPGA